MKPGTYERTELTNLRKELTVRTKHYPVMLEKHRAFEAEYRTKLQYLEDHYKQTLKEEK